MPAFYLRKWARPTPAGKLFEFRKIQGGRFGQKQVTAKATGYRPFLYSQKTSIDGVLDHSFESEPLKDLDAAANISLKSLLSKTTLSRDDRRAWATFIYAQILRSPQELKAALEFDATSRERDTPEAEAEFAKIFEEFPAEVLNRHFKKLEGEGRPKTYAEYRSRQPRHELEQETFEAFAWGLKNARAINDIFGLRWLSRTLKNSKFELLTSDRPILTNNRPLDPDGYIMMPLSPNCLFIAQPPTSPPHFLVSAPESIVAKIANRSVVEQAEEYVWAGDNRQSEFIQKWIGSMPAPSAHQLWMERLSEKISEGAPIKS